MLIECAPSYKRIYGGSHSLPLKHVLARRVSVFERLDLAVLNDEFQHNVREVLDSKLETLIRHQLLFGLPGNLYEEAGILFVHHLKLEALRCLVSPRELAEHRRVE